MTDVDRNFYGPQMMWRTGGCYGTISDPIFTVLGLAAAIAVLLVR
jgi:hypothetical protein